MDEKTHSQRNDGGKRKNLRKSFLLISVVLTLAACNTTETTTESESAVDTVSEKFAEEEIEAAVNMIVDGKVDPSSSSWHSPKNTNLLAFMKEHYKILQEDNVIIDIKGNRPGEGEVWTYTVNGKTTGKEPIDYIVADGDVIEWTITAD